jgi:hypothetical protein
MSLGPRALRAALLVVALVAILACAAGAAAETRTGEGAQPLISEEPRPQETLVKAAASYDTTTGAVTFNLTMAGEPRSAPEISYGAGLVVAPAGCNVLAFEEGFSGDLLLQVSDEWEEPISASFGESGPGGSLEELGLAGKSVSGTTATYSFSSSKLANQGFNCAFAFAGDSGGNSIMYFPIKTVASPPSSEPTSPVSPPDSGPPAPTPAAPAPAPAALSIGRLSPAQVQAGKSRSVTVKVTNTGGTATSPGTLRVTAPKGIEVKPERQRLPVLAPGGSCTVTIRVEPTKKAKKKSTVSLTAAAPGVTGTGSLVVKLKKG